MIYEKPVAIAEVPLNAIKNTNIKCKQSADAHNSFNTASATAYEADE
jgi:hypothetical protein